VITFERSEVFDEWLAGLKDLRARARILSRLDSAALGNFGDCKYVAERVYEMRIHVGPGYRLYYTHRDGQVYLLLVGGDKGTQRRDIRRALEMVGDL
jgi:putative addiction module killer protein